MITVLPAYFGRYFIQKYFKRIVDFFRGLGREGILKITIHKRLSKILADIK
jgi:hypothetical protein